MKKALKIILILLLIQGLASIKLSAEIGIKGGLNLSNFFFSDSLGSEWNYLQNFQAGAFFSIYLLKNFSIQPELLYTKKGATADGMFKGEKITESEELTYIKIPLLVKVQFPYKVNFKVGFFSGIYTAINIGAKSITKYKDESIEEDIKNEIKDMDFGFVLGLNIEFKKLIFDFRYTTGFSNIKSDPFVDFSIKNHTLVFMIGYIF